MRKTTVKRRKTRSAYPASGTKFFQVFVVWSVLIFILVSAVTIFLQRSRPVSLRPIRIVAMLKPPRLYLPGPLTISTLDTEVLGAETFDPRDIITYVNNERLMRGIPPLRENPLLSRAAEMRTEAIMKHQNFSHSDPYDGIELHTVLPKVGYSFIYATENIGMGGRGGKDFVNGFMHSTMHRENLLNPQLIETGAATASGPYHQYYVGVVVQLFADPVKKETSLGYTEQDKKEFETLLRDIESQLRLTQSALTSNTDNNEYYESWQKILIRQQEIVASLYYRMKESQPLLINTESLIEEFNNNWNLTPPIPDPMI